MKVHWTDTAVEHLAKIHAYMAHDSPAYASRVVDRLTRRSKQIGRFPNSGRVVPESDHPQVREVIEGAYRIVYRIKEKQIDVIAVIHGAQHSPWMLRSEERRVGKECRL